MKAQMLVVVAMLATAAADYGDPRKGACATGDSECVSPRGEGRGGDPPGGGTGEEGV